MDALQGQLTRIENELHDIKMKIPHPAPGHMWIIIMLIAIMMHLGMCK